MRPPQQPPLCQKVSLYARAGSVDSALKDCIMQTQNETETEGRYDDAFTASSTDRLVAVGL